MEKSEVADIGGVSTLTTSPQNVKPEEVKLAKRSAITRPGFGRNGRRIQCLLLGKGIGRKVILYQTYCLELVGKNFAYDGEKSLYTVGPLPRNNFEFTVVLEESSLMRNGRPGLNGSPSEVDDRKRSRRSCQSKTYKARFKISGFGGETMDSTQDALRVLDNILRQQAANRGCLLVRQSFFHDDVRNFTNVRGGLIGCRGLLSSFCTTQSDVSTTMILTPGSVLDFLTTNQNAKKMLKNMRIKTRHNNMEFKIIGLSEKPCNQQSFTLKVKNGDGAEGEDQRMEVTVYDYFVQHRKIDLTYSAYMPCLDVGKSKRPNYLPLELCSLVSLQRYMKGLSSMQRSTLVEKSTQKPQEHIKVVTDMLTAVDGCVLNAPTLKVGNNEDCVPRNGRWNFNNKKLLNLTRIYNWALVNFSARCDMSYLSRKLINCGRNKGIIIECPHTLIEEDPLWKRAGPVVRVIRWPWKRKNLHEWGIVTQCISPIKINDQYWTNVLLKINSKLGGINSILAIEHSPCIPFIKETPTMILGMDVSHGSPGRSDVPSIAAAFQHLGETWLPKFIVIVAQKNHHTKLFQANAPENMPPGTVVDTKVVHPRKYDFYMCAQAGIIGTSHPAHYHVLLDEIGFTADDLQSLVHSLSYVYQRSTTAISVVAPVCYAHLAAQQMGQVRRHGGVTSADSVPVPELPRLHKNIESSMFFC
ncbi:hypothetical protein NE237_001123 [Protea cynaroides]|uniref:Uncharacterized protein n=1 Tax=Protea cynaroides TaxID=273540 RepID=A0A9Q0QY41_9MAGN|nr:hypothetical protein NE237_001123 [Protea cynaroides]